MMGEWISDRYLAESWNRFILPDEDWLLSVQHRRDNGRVGILEYWCRTSWWWENGRKEKNKESRLFHAQVLDTSNIAIFHISSKIIHHIDSYWNIASWGENSSYSSTSIHPNCITQTTLIEYEEQEPNKSMCTHPFSGYDWRISLVSAEAIVLVFIAYMWCIVEQGSKPLYGEITSYALYFVHRQYMFPREDLMRMITGQSRWKHARGIGLGLGSGELLNPDLGMVERAGERWCWSSSK